MSDKIYRCYATGLGDVTASLMLFTRWSLERSEPIYVSTWYPKGNGQKSYKEKATEVLSLINSKDSQVILTDEAPTEPYPTNEDLKYSFYEFKYTWDNPNTKIVTYQFDGKSHAEKNFDSFDVWDEIENHLKFNGYSPVRLGAHLTIEQCVLLLSVSEFYVGVPSGMGVLSFGTGTPYYMIRNGLQNLPWLQSIKYGDFMILDDRYQFYTTYPKGLEYYSSHCLNKKV